MFKLAGLTGGIGTGKSTEARMIRDLGVPVIDADLLARQVVEPGQPAHAEIVAAWPDVVDQSGSIDRKKLAERIFADSAARVRLEAITHPRIMKRALAQASAGSPQESPARGRSRARARTGRSSLRVTMNPPPLLPKNQHSSGKSGGVHVAAILRFRGRLQAKTCAAGKDAKRKAKRVPLIPATVNVVQLCDGGSCRRQCRPWLSASALRTG